MPYLAIIVCKDANTIEPLSLVVDSARWSVNGAGATIKFLDIEDRLSNWWGKGYEAVAVDAKLSQERVTLWESAESNDRVICLSHPTKSAVDRCLEWLKTAELSHFRVLATVSKDSLHQSLNDLMRVAYHHMPTDRLENVDRTVGYCLSLLNKLRPPEVLTPSRPILPLRKVEIKATESLTARGEESPDDGMSLVLNAGGQPVMFGPDFKQHGFRINSEIASECAEGILVTDGPHGAALYGPYLEVGPGQYAATVSLRDMEGDGGSAAGKPLSRSAGIVAFDVYLASLDTVVAAAELPEAGLRDGAMLHVSFTVPVHSEQVLLELRVHQRSGKSFLIESIELACL